MTKKAIDTLMSIGIDIGKDTFHLVGFDLDGQTSALGMANTSIRTDASRQVGCGFSQ